MYVCTFVTDIWLWSLIEHFLDPHKGAKELKRPHRAYNHTYIHTYIHAYIHTYIGTREATIFNDLVLF